MCETVRSTILDIAQLVMPAGMHAVVGDNHTYVRLIFMSMYNQSWLPLTCCNCCDGFLQVEQEADFDEGLETIDLEAEGASKPATDDIKQQYVNLYVRHLLELHSASI